MKQEAKHLAPPEKGRSRAPLIVIIVLAVLIAAYLGFCAWVWPVTSWPRMTAPRQKVSLCWTQAQKPR